MDIVAIETEDSGGGNISRSKINFTTLREKKNAAQLELHKQRQARQAARQSHELNSMAQQPAHHASALKEVIAWQKQQSAAIKQHASSRDPIKSIKGPANTQKRMTYQFSSDTRNNR